MVDRPAAREIVPLAPDQPFRWIEHDYPAPVPRWSHHPEIEIHLIRRSEGSYIIGDRIGAFGPGHVAIVGPDVPHDWISDLGPGEVVEARDALIQFTAEWLERSVAATRNLGELRGLVEASRRGITYSGPTASAAADLIERVGDTTGAIQVAHFLGLLSLLLHAPDQDRHFVADAPSSAGVGRQGKAALDVGLAYVLANIASNVRMSEAAKLAYMSEPSFSKHFKKASGMTFTHLVRRLRIANACRLLETSDSSVASIGIDVGYRNLANFNRQFRAETGTTPREYRAAHLAEIYAQGPGARVLSEPERG